MASMNDTPSIGILTDTEADICSGPAANYENLYDIEVSNVSNTAANCYIWLAKTDGSVTKRSICPGKSISGKDALMVRKGMAIPYGWKLIGRSDTTNVLEFVITSVRRRTL